jgi:hypothetical protein
LPPHCLDNRRDQRRRIPPSDTRARHVGSGALWGFTEVGELVFDVHDGVVIDPTEERLRDEFGNTRVLHLPMHSIVRVEEVERKGQSAIRDATTGEKVVTPFPLPAKPR